MADILSSKPRFNGDKNAPIKRIVQNETSDNDGIYTDEEIKQKIKRHKIQKIKKIGLVIIAVVVVILIAMNMIENRTYSSYKLVKSESREDVESAEYMDYNDGYLRYSNNGISYFKQDGTPIWDQSFDMHKPQVKICEKNIAVGDINGNVIYVFDDNGYIKDINTSLLITQIEIAKNGIVVAVLEDNNANYINMYDKTGDKVYSVKTTLSGDGYPFDISITDDGTKLMASYIYVNDEKMKNNIVFYNFSEVGKNETERVVGGYDFDTTIVGDVQFLTNNKAVAISEKSINIYRIKETPKLYKTIEVDDEILKYFYGKDTIGIVTNNTDSVNAYKLMVYNLSGKKICETEFNTDYDNIQVDNKTIIMNNSQSICVMNFKGKVLANISFDSSISDVVTVGRRDKYIIISSKYIRTIKLK